MFYVEFCEVCEVNKIKKKKIKKLKRNFIRLYLGNGWSDFLQIWFVDSRTGRHVASKFGSNRIRDQV